MANEALIHLCRVYRNEPLNFIQEYNSNATFQQYVRQNGAIPVAEGGSYFLVHYPSNEILVRGPPIPRMQGQMGIQGQGTSPNPLTGSQYIGAGGGNPQTNHNPSMMNSQIPHPSHQPEVQRAVAGNKGPVNTNHAFHPLLYGKGGMQPTGNDRAAPWQQQTSAPFDQRSTHETLAQPSPVRDFQSDQQTNMYRQSASNFETVRPAGNTASMNHPFQSLPTMKNTNGNPLRKQEESSFRNPVIPAVQKLFEAQSRFEGHGNGHQVEPRLQNGRQSRISDGKSEPRMKSKMENRSRSVQAGLEENEAEDLISELEAVHLETVKTSKAKAKERPSKPQLYRPPPRKPMRVSSRRAYYAKGWNHVGSQRKGVALEVTNSGEALYRFLCPSVDDAKKRNRLTAHLRKVIRSEWPNSSLYMYGSSATGMFLERGDVDVCLEIPNVKRTSDGDDGGRRTQHLVFKRLSFILRRARMNNVKVLFSAKVPIVKLHDSVSGLDVDICLNNKYVSHNTALLKHYLGLDERAKPLAMIVKYWARCRRINYTYCGTLSSYAYMMLVINYLQCLSPPCLPCLQKEKDEGGNLSNHSDYPLWFNRKLTRSVYKSRNRQSLGDLFLGFFRFYAREFDYENEVVSVRNGCRLRKSEKTWANTIDEGSMSSVEEEEQQGQSNGIGNGNKRRSKSRKTELAVVDREVGHRFSIEDPFVVSHDLGRGMDIETLGVLKDEFELAYCRLVSTGKVESICKAWEDCKVKLIVSGSPHIEGEQDRGMIIRKKTTRVELAEDEAIGSVLNMAWEDLELGQVKFDKEKRDFPVPWVKREGGEVLDRSMTIKSLRLRDNDRLVVGFDRRAVKTRGDAEKKEGEAQLKPHNK